MMEDPTIEPYDAVLFMVSPQMLNMSLMQQCAQAASQLHPHNRSIHQTCVSLLYNLCTQSNKAIGIVLPGITYSNVLKSYAHQFVETLLGIKKEPTHTKTVVREFTDHLLEPDSKKGILFGTSLLMPGTPTFTPIQKTYAINTATNNLSTITTPIDNGAHTNHLVLKALPTGLLYHNEHTNTLFFVGKLSDFTFADADEHFFKNPEPLVARNHLLQAAQDSLHAWHCAIQEQKLPSQQPTQIPLPSNFSISHLAQEKQRIQQKHNNYKPHYNWLTNRSISCAWFDPYDCFAHLDKQRKLEKKVNGSIPSHAPNIETKKKIEALALKRGIEIMYDGAFDILWLEFLPEWYLSRNAIRREQRMEYCKRVELFAKDLNQYFTFKGMRLPKIFVGMNLTSNFKTYPVRNPVFDINGHMYSKIPCPFDVRHFWKPEVIDTFVSFHALFQRHLKIDGVFFDFEMYHAQDQSGAYTPRMDFSPMSWQVYCLYSKDRTALQAKTFNDRIAYLKKAKKFDAYFNVLQQASCDIGKAVKKALQTKVPNLIIGAYAPTLPSSWFYKGIYAGLSSPQEPLLLATFNTDYASHAQWLAANNIQLLHGSAMMLSKLNKPYDFNKITSLLMHHDFVWYNHPSRMIYEYDTNDLSHVWWGVEATATNRKYVMNGIRHQHLAIKR